jgi:hypothetical protein
MSSVIFSSVKEATLISVDNQIVEANSMKERWETEQTEELTPNESELIPESEENSK